MMPYYVCVIRIRIILNFSSLENKSDGLRYFRIPSTLNFYMKYLGGRT